MRTLVIYKSKTGSTQKYAEEIARAIGGDILSIKKFKRKHIDNYDTIVFGGWVMGGKIQGLDDFLVHYDDMKDKNIIVFAVGMSLVTKESRDNLISVNILDLYHVRFYQLRGSFDFNKLSFFTRILMANSIKMSAAQGGDAMQQQALEQIKERPIEFYDQAGIDRIVSVLHKIDAIGGEA